MIHISFHPAAKTTVIVVKVILSTLYCFIKHLLFLELVFHQSTHLIYSETYLYLTTSGPLPRHGAPCMYKPDYYCICSGIQHVKGLNCSLYGQQEKNFHTVVENYRTMEVNLKEIMDFTTGLFGSLR